MNQIQEQTIEGLDIAEERKLFIPSSGGEMKEATDYKAVWNLHSNSLGCIASKKYNIIQHRDVVNSLFNALDNLNINYNFEVKTDGHRIFVNILFPETKILVKEEGIREEFVGGLKLINSYDKTTGLLILPRIQRLACLNGMVVSKFITGYSIRHNQKLIEDFEGIIEKSLKSMINSSDVLKAVINRCIGDSVEWKLAEIVLLNLLRRKKHVEEIMDLLEEKDSVTRWDIYNALTRYATHDKQLKPNVENWLQNKAQKLLETNLESLSDEKILEIIC